MARREMMRVISVSPREVIDQGLVAAARSGWRRGGFYAGLGGTVKQRREFSAGTVWNKLARDGFGAKRQWHRWRKSTGAASATRRFGAKDWRRSNVCRSQLIKREFNVVYTPLEDGWIMAQVPELPGAVTQGRDMDEAREMIQEAVELLLQSYRENAA